MKKILVISGSARKNSANLKLIKSLLAAPLPYHIYPYPDIIYLPLFVSDLDRSPWPSSVLAWRNAVQQSDALMITSPAYLFNIPAVLKNALEWLSTSGELNGKPVLPITFTPHAPRGEKAMQSLIWSLGALNARVVVELPLYQNQISFHQDGSIIENDQKILIEEALKLLF